MLWDVWRHGANGHALDSVAMVSTMSTHHHYQSMVAVLPHIPDQRIVSSALDQETEQIVSSFAIISESVALSRAHLSQIWGIVPLPPALPTDVLDDSYRATDHPIFWERWLRSSRTSAIRSAQIGSIVIQRSTLADTRCHFWKRMPS